MNDSNLNNGLTDANQSDTESVLSQQTAKPPSIIQPCEGSASGSGEASPSQSAKNFQHPPNEGLYLPESQSTHAEENIEIDYSLLEVVRRQMRERNDIP